MTRSTPLLHRDDPEKEPLIGNVKVTREDWLNIAMDVLVSDGVEKVKVLTLGERLGVSRSSFYWYFKSRQDLLNALLDHWQQTNTLAMVAQTEAPAPTITAAVLNVFRCVVNKDLFNYALDFTVRDWARRSGHVRRALDQSNQKRVSAIAAMFERYGYAPVEALTRAKVLYFMQIGYDDADLREPLEERMSALSMYLFIFTGREAPEVELEEFKDYAYRAINGDTS